MEKVNIPAKVLLDAMMQQLGLPNALYSSHKGRLVSLDATIHFYGCKHELDNKLPRKSISIPVFGKLKEAENQLAIEALKIMQDTYSKVLQDLNYDKLQLVQQKRKSLEHQHKEKDGIIDYLSNSWSSSLTEERMAASELNRIIDTNFSASSTSNNNNLNHIFSQVKGVADHLTDTTTQSEYDLQQTNQCYWSLDDDNEGISALGDEGHE